MVVVRFYNGFLYFLELVKGTWESKIKGMETESYFI